MNPLADIEDRHVANGLGTLAANIYAGARAEGLGRVDAMMTTAAAILAIMQNGSALGEESE